MHAVVLFTALLALPPTPNPSLLRVAATLLLQVHDGDIIKHGMLDTARFLADVQELQAEAAKQGRCVGSMWLVV